MEYINKCIGNFKTHAAPSKSYQQLEMCTDYLEYVDFYRNGRISWSRCRVRLAHETHMSSFNPCILTRRRQAYVVTWHLPLTAIFEKEKKSIAAF